MGELVVSLFHLHPVHRQVGVSRCGSREGRFRFLKGVKLTLVSFGTSGDSDGVDHTTPLYWTTEEGPFVGSTTILDAESREGTSNSGADHLAPS